MDDRDDFIKMVKKIDAFISVVKWVVFVVWFAVAFTFIWAVTKLTIHFAG